MTIKNKKIAKRACAVMLSAAMAMPIGIPAMNVKAEGADEAYKTAYTTEGYNFVWGDEFDGTSLNTEDWNVEAHDPGWVNAELQRYVSANDMSDNISVADGKLKITPTAEKNNDGIEMLSGKGFDDTWGSHVQTDAATGSSIVKSDGKATVTINDPGKESWHIHLKQSPQSLELNHQYIFKMKATASDECTVKAFTQDPTNNYKWYGGTEQPLSKDEETWVTFTVDVDGENGKVTSNNIDLQIEFGGSLNTKKDNPTTVVLSDVSFTDVTAKEPGDIDVKTDYRYTSGRINTQKKHDFTYGRFECRAKVPTGQGYLPAFWLMATDENNYGQWPQCGEMDIMEVMGQETNKSYHTIHYGYDSGSGHRQNQGTKTLETGDFSSEYHTYTLDWEPGKLTWYVDGEQVYTTNDWFTGKDSESQLSYPAPFDQDFYVILNLAVGGSWVGYPTQEVVDNIIKENADQSFYVDYVRVYQKEDEYYEALEESVEKPVHEVVFRDADANGNYVVNGDFSKELKASDSTEDNFELHIEADAKDTTYKIKNNEITITPSAAGGVDYSVQLKQTGVPMYKGWEYELSFDAYADAERTMIIDIEGPDNGWTRYFGDKKETITTEKKNYKYTFTMDQKTDANGSLEFCLGNQGSTAPVHISNIKLIHKSGETSGNEIEKTVRADGNYIYNGSFDQGDKRLGYWEMDEDDQARVSVTNKTVEGSNGKVRELCAKIDVPEGTSKVNPITLSQSELAPILKGLYQISFDAYMEDGASADAITVNVAGIEYKPEITTSKKNYSKKLQFDEDLSRKDSNVSITFTKPGTYYLDNIMLAEAALIKNGSFNAGLSGFDPYVYNGELASYVVDSINNPSSFVMTINDTGADKAGDDWYIQLNQDNVTLEKGRKYNISFKAKSTIARSIRYGLTENGGAWTNYSKTDNPIKLTTEWQTFSKEFTMESETDTATRFNITMGSVGGTRITEKHDVLIDDILLVDLTALEEEKKAEEDKAAADAVIEKIKAIGKVDATDASKAKIDEAKKAYEALTKDQQALADKSEAKNKLDQAEKDYKAAVDAKAEADKKAEDAKKAEQKKTDDKKAADEAVAKIDAIGTVDATDASKAKIDEAENAVKALTADQKALIPAETLKKIEDAKSAYEAAVAAYDAAKGSSNKNGVAEAGETAITEQGTFTAKNAKEASYTQSEAAKNSASVEIPATVKIDGVDVEVTEIAPNAFKGDKKLTKLTVGANIKTIGEGAFQDNTKLTTVKFKGNKVTEVAKNTFAGDKSLTDVDLSNQKNLKSIKANAFKGCKKLKKFKVNGDKLKKVDKTAFKGCPNKKSVKVTIYTKTKAQYKKVVKMFKKAGLTKVTFKRSKTK